MLKQLSLLDKYNHIITSWEKENNKWFNGTESDIYEFKDLVNHCNELNQETPLTLILDGIYIPVGGSALRPYDLREYV